MPDQTLALAPVDSFVFEPQDRKPRLTWTGAVTAAMSLLVIGAAVYQLYQARALDLVDIPALVPSSPVFWLLFAATYLAGPFSEWLIFRRLWHVGPEAFGALVRKLIYNELLVGYLGEVYFYGWARKHLALVSTPFGAVKDVAVLSAVAGNVMTLVFLAFAFPLQRLLPRPDHVTAIAWSFAFVIGTSLVAMLWRRAIFSLDRGELRFTLGLHLIRILATTLFSAALWHIVLPGVPARWWLLLATVRLLISRLPFIPNKDFVFAGVAVMVLGRDVELAALMALMAGLILLTHVLTGLAFALADLLCGDSDAPRPG